MVLIGLGHRMRMGKDTVASYLAEEYDFQIFHFTDALHRECRAAKIVFSAPPYRPPDSIFLPIHMLYINNVRYEDHGLLRRVQMWNPLRGWRPREGGGVIYDGMKEKDRGLLQWWGTDFRRRLFGEDYWIRRTKAAILKSKAERVVVADTRFPNEAQWIQHRGGMLWKIHRSRDPEIPLEEPIRGSIEHQSETALDRWDWDRTILNKGTIKDLHKEVDVAMRPDTIFGMAVAYSRARQRKAMKLIERGKDEENEERKGAEESPQDAQEDA